MSVEKLDPEHYPTAIAEYPTEILEKSDRAVLVGLLGRSNRSIRLSANRV
jgi:hypothetical protein